MVGAGAEGERARGRLERNYNSQHLLKIPCAEKHAKLCRHIQFNPHNPMKRFMLLSPFYT